MLYHVTPLVLSTDVHCQKFFSLKTHFELWIPPFWNIALFLRVRVQILLSLRVSGPRHTLLSLTYNRQNK